MIDGVVGRALELPRSLQQFARVWRQSNVDPELAIACRPRDFALDRVDALDERQRVSERLARPVGQRVVISALVTASNVVFVERGRTSS